MDARAQGREIKDCKRQSGRVRLYEKRGKTKKMCAEVILGCLLHVVGCIVPLPHPRPQRLAELWSTSADNHMKGLFVRSHFSPKPVGRSSSMLAPVVHYIFKLRLYPLGHRALAMTCGVHEAMKALAGFFLFSGLCCWWFGPQMLPLRNPPMRPADVSHSNALVSRISSVSSIGIPSWWDVKSCRHRVSTSEQVRELELTLVIIFGAVMFLKGTTVAIRNYRNPFINPWRGF